MHSSTLTGISPSFTAYSSNNLADVAARVVEEFRNENGGEYDDIFNSNDYGYGYDYDNTEFSVTVDEKADTVIINPEEMKEANNCHNDDNKDKDNDNDDDEFEFAVVCNDVNSSSVSADEMFSQGHIIPKYPLFDQSLLLDVNPDLNNVVNDTAEPVRLPLRKLFSEDRDFGSSSSSEADDLDGISPNTYCVWKPKKTQSPERCKKSNSTGNSSRRWKFRDMLYRSNSDSKESPFMFFKHSNVTNKKINNDKVKKVDKQVKANGSSTEKHNRRQSYLPPGEALATAFNTVSRSNRNLHIF